MKKVILFTSFALVLTSCTQKPAATYSNRADSIAAELCDPNSKYVVVACHRGDWRNYPENSIPAIESIIRYGADIMELDLKRTKDSVLILSHDKDLLRCTNFKDVFKDEPGKSAKVSDLTFEEVQRLSLKRAHGVTVDTIKVPTLYQALECCKDRICVNVDQGFEYYDQVMDIAEEVGVVNQILIKSKKPIEEVESIQSSHPDKMMYMPIVDILTGNGEKLFNSYMDEGVVPIAYEVCWSNNNTPAFSQTCKKIIDQGSKIWVNTIWASLCGGDGNDDDAAFQAEDPGVVYSQYLENGVSIFQTDRPELLIGWLEKQGRHTLK